MTVSIQFCGGCNPRYDREAFAERIREAYPDIEFLYNAKENIDAVLVLCGCTAACAMIPKELESIRKWTVCSEKMWDETSAFFDSVREPNEFST